MAATMNIQEALEAILGMGCSSNLSSLAWTSSEESKRDEEPCEKDFLKIHLWLSYLVSEFEVSSFHAITICHFEHLYPCDIIGFAFWLFTDINFHILIFDLFGDA